MSSQTEGKQNILLWIEVANNDQAAVLLLTLGSNPRLNESVSECYLTRRSKRFVLNSGGRGKKGGGFATVSSSYKV